eukprot:Pgem_evm1s341
MTIATTANQSNDSWCNISNNNNNSNNMNYNNNTNNELNSALMKTIADITSQFIWGSDCPRETLIEIVGCIDNYASAVLAPVPLLIPGTTFAKGMIAKAKLDTLVKEELKRRTSDPNSEKRTDAMQQLINKYHTGELTEQQVIDNCRILIFAAVDTTTSSLTIVTHFLFTHPEFLAKVRQETVHVLGEQAWLEKDLTPSPAEIQKLKYCKAVIKEALRITTPTMFGMRVAKADTTVVSKKTSYVIPKGAQVVTSLYHTMKSHPGFLQPDEADPERFMKADVIKADKLAYTLFGNGARSCPGASMAMLEMVIFVSMLSQYETVITNSTPIEYKRTMFLVPKDGIY